MSRRLRSRSMALGALLLLAATMQGGQLSEARSKAAPPPKVVPRLDIPFSKYKLENGLTVILAEDHRLPLVAVDVWYHVGPIQEAAGRTGFAHLFEHLMFQGSKHIADDQHFALLEAAGASMINGTTDFDRTNYFETVPKNQLELALWLESDRMGFLLETMTQDKLDNQREVVQNERRQSIENVPYGLGEERMFQLLYPKGHPYYGYVIGSHADLEATKLEDVVDFFKRYYAPSNASLVICGDFDPKTVKATVDKYFGPIAAGPPVTPLVTPDVVITKEKRAALTDNVQLPRLYMAWLSPKIYQPGDAEADLLAKILGNGKSSRLYKRLVYDKKIAQDVAAQQYSLILGSVFNLQVTAKPGHTLAELEREVDAVLAELATTPIPDDELARAKRIYEAGFLRALEGIGGFGGKADRLNQYEHYLGDPGWLGKDLARHRDATPAGLQAIARDVLAKNKRVVITVSPKPAVKPAVKPPVKPPVKPTPSKTGGAK